MEYRQSGAYLVPSEQPPDPIAISRFVRLSHFADVEAQLRPPTTAPLVFPALARYCASYASSRGHPRGISGGSGRSSDGGRRGSYSSQGGSSQVGLSQGGLSQMELFGGAINTDLFLAPATPRRSAVGSDPLCGGGLSGPSQGWGAPRDDRPYERPREPSPRRPPQPHFNATSNGDPHAAASPRTQPVPHPSRGPSPHTRPSPWNRGGAALTPSLANLLDAPPHKATPSAPARKRAAAPGHDEPRSEQAPGHADPAGRAGQPDARRHEHSPRGEPTPAPPHLTRTPKRQATTSSPPRSLPSPRSSAAADSGLLRRPSFAAPRPPSSDAALPRNFFRGLGEPGAGGNAILNGALDPGMLRRWFAGAARAANGSDDDDDGNSGNQCAGSQLDGSGGLSQAFCRSSQADGGSAAAEQGPAGCLFHVGLVWRDAELSTNFTPTAAKHCTPSQDCAKWFCSCKRAIRASVAFAPLLGCLVLHQVAPTTSSDAAASQRAAHPCQGRPDPVAVFLPLVPCEGDLADDADADADDSGGGAPWVAPFAAAADGPPLPLASQSSLRARWAVFRDLLCRQAVVGFNAQLLYMACFAHACGGSPGGSQLQRPVPSTVQVFDPKVAGWLLCSSDSGAQARFDFPELYRTYCRQLGPPPAFGAASSHDKSDGNSSQRPIGMPGSLPSPAASGLAGRGTLALRSLHESLGANFALAEQLMEQLGSQGLLAAAQELEMPLVPLLAAMEVRGVGFAPQVLTRNQPLLEGEMARQASAAQELAGRSFNVASAEQVAAALYGHLKLLPPGGSSGHGSGSGKKHASTKEEVLLLLQAQHPCVGAILRHRTLAKLKGTYIDGLLEFAVPSDAGQDVHGPRGAQPQRWRLHAEWNQLSVETGRLSASKPAIQTIPRDPEPIVLDSATSSSASSQSSSFVASLNVRSAFVASPGCVLVAVDYSQIEMRVLAHFCQDPQLLGLFADLSGDVYKLVAAALLRKPASSVEKQERNLAKTCCLGIIYGMGTKELAKRYQVADAVAAKFVATFHGAFPAVKQWTAHVKRQCHVQGFVTTITQRRRLVARAADGDGAAKARQDRQAVNSVVQGSASDIMKLAMIDIHHKLDHDTTEADPATASSSAAPAISRPPPPRMILQVHDELIFEVAAQPKAIAQLVTTVRHCMEVEVVASLGLKVPLVVTTMVGPSWGNMRAFVGSSAGSIAVAPAAAGGGPPQAPTRQSSSPHTPPPLPLGPTQRGQQPSQQQFNYPLQPPLPSHFPTSSPFFTTRASQGAPSTIGTTRPPVLFSQ